MDTSYRVEGYPLLLGVEKFYEDWMANVVQ